MYTFEKRITINRGQQEVFTFVTNPFNQPLWQGGIDYAEWISPPPPGVGSKYKVVAYFWGLKIISDFEITSWDPPHAYSFRSTAGPFPIKGSSRFKRNGKSTVVILKGGIKSSGPFKILEGLVGRQAEKQDGKNFKQLKNLLEAGPVRTVLVESRR